jgi:endonuclease YncB( thermonuclease family)
MGNKINKLQFNTGGKRSLNVNIMSQTLQKTCYKLTGEFDCKVVDVYDGDTVTIVVCVKGGMEQHKLRMLGYDSPEIRPLKSIDNRDEHIASAKRSKAFLYDLVINKHCIFESKPGDKDKYGRLLGNLYTTKNGIKDRHVNQIMVDSGHGYSYYGGAKRI